MSREFNLIFTPNFTEHCLFLGRNGAGKMTALNCFQRFSGSMPVLSIQPVLSTGKLARCEMEIPFAAIPVLIQELTALYQANHEALNLPAIEPVPAPSIICIDVHYQGDPEHCEKTDIFPDTPEGIKAAFEWGNTINDPIDGEPRDLICDRWQVFRCGLNVNHGANMYGYADQIVLTDDKTTL